MLQSQQKNLVPLFFISGCVGVCACELDTINVELSCMYNAVLHLLLIDGFCFALHLFEDSSDDFDDFPCFVL